MPTEKTFPPSGLLQYLPAIYREDPFLGQFLLAFEKILLGRDDSPAEDKSGEDYRGWPRPGRDAEERERMRELRATLWPPEWWLRVRYGGRPGAMGRAASLVRHAMEEDEPGANHDRPGEALSRENAL